MPVFASTTTYERSEDNLQISSDIIVNSSNKKAILITPKVNETEKIYDFANLITAAEEDMLFRSISEFTDSYNLDMAIVTIASNNKSSAMAYADDFYDYNYFGKGTTHDGLLFLIDMDTREMWISTKGNAILIFDDDRIDRILDKTYEKISNAKYYECAKAFITESEEYAELGIPESNTNAIIDDKGEYIVSEDYSDSEFPIAGISVISFVAALIFVLIAKSMHKMIRRQTNANDYLDKDSVLITNKENTFINTYTTSYRIESSSSSGGSFGGSSTHHSSSGGSHGGGGRHF